MKGYLFSVLCLLFSGLVQAQAPAVNLETATTLYPEARERCGTTALHRFRHDLDPGYAQRRAEIEAFTQDWISNQRKTAAVITIPVVIHVVYENPTQNISDAQIMSQLTALNEDYRRLNSDTSSTPMDFQSIAVDTEIEFCLATVDPNGDPTTGITRTSTTVDEIGNSGIHYTAQGGHDAWDPTMYMNFWVCEIENGGGILGYATPPGFGAAAEDGCVMDYRYFGTMGTVQAPFDLGRTTTHEVGHYLNLEHVWGVFGGCSDDDLVGDTPNQNTSSFGCPSHPSMSCGSADMFMNYMDYSDDNCMNAFSQGQKDRMLAALNGPRASLLTSTVCTPVVSVEPATRSSFTVFPNPSQGQVSLDLQLTTFESVEVNIYNVLGTRFIQRNYSDLQQDRIDLDLSGLDQGLYLVEVRTASEKMTRRLLLQ